MGSINFQPQLRAQHSQRWVLGPLTEMSFNIFESELLDDTTTNTLHF